MQCLSIWFHPFSEVVRASFYCVHIIYLCLQKGEGGWGQHIISVMYTMMGGGGQQGQFVLGPSVRGTLNSAELVQMRILLVVSA